MLVAEVKPSPTILNSSFKTYKNPFPKCGLPWVRHQGTNFQLSDVLQSDQVLKNVENFNEEHSTIGVFDVWEPDGKEQAIDFGWVFFSKLGLWTVLAGFVLLWLAKTSEENKKKKIYEPVKSF